MAQEEPSHTIPPNVVNSSVDAPERPPTDRPRLGTSEAPPNATSLHHNPPRTPDHEKANSLEDPASHPRGTHSPEEFPRRPSPADHHQQQQQQQPTTNVQISDHSRSPSREMETPEPERLRDSSGPMPVTKTVPFRQHPVTHAGTDVHQPQSAVVSSVDNQRSESPRLNHPDEGSRWARHDSRGSIENESEPANCYPQLQYHHDQLSSATRARKRDERNSRGTIRSSYSDSPSSSITGENGATPGRFLSPLGGHPHGLHPLPRPSSSYSTLSLPDNGMGRDLSPGGSPRHPNDLSPRSGRSPESRPVSYVDLLNAPYPQPAPAAANFNNTHLQTAVGSNASLLSNQKTLEMYRANAKKTNDAKVQYEFALFMINAANEAESTQNGALQQAQSGRDLDSPFVDNSTAASKRAEMLKEARQILQKLSDRSYPFAQYYLGDGYASGLLNKGKEDYDKAFPLFVSASKHGHAEAGYRSALCFEFGWGCRKDPAKAVQFYRHSASKNHPGAMTRLGKACLVGDLGLGKRYREGLKWLKRATESADRQYNRAPYEMGLLYEMGYGEDVFRDESYAAQLFTQAAELGHAEASYRLGDAYEHGKLSCPRDPALSVHFYNGAAQQAHPAAMMALCAWYIVGAEPVLAKDDNEAYQWAKQAAECGFVKAEYAVGYFTEMGIGCRRDPLEANVWYVRAADQGDERATHRLATIRAAAAGDGPAASVAQAKGKKGATATSGGGKDEKDCIIM
ncbi:MAG: hypothetical protein M1837_003158 [Sclerophora amabilis]|nr:MAG: hypothetical protein M1837_003158 [Sclerophora amabilis]